jgi:sensor histidine kinase YesM
MKVKYKVAIHLGYWFYMFNQFVFPYYIGQAQKYTWQDIIVSLILSMANFYAIYFLMPVMLKRAKLWQVVIMGVFLIVGLGYLRFNAEGFIWHNLLKMPSTSDASTASWLAISIRNSIVSAIYAILIRLAIDWYDAQRLRTELLTQNQASELALLRSQVNPHFLFNTLNNIYSLVYKKSDEAPEAVMKLSAIMRYMLYEANADKVMLHQEVEYLKSFIELQKLRLKNNDFVKFTIEGDIGFKRIAPMLLVPFVENAFKHGNRNVEGPGIKIRLKAMEDETLFEVENHIKPYKDDENIQSSGIGLQNVKRRLNLLYPDAHSLNISEIDGIYKVTLILITQ